MKNIAVILAAGRGSRMETSTPKQFITIGGKTIIEHVLSTFQQHAQIDEIAVVTAEEDIPRIEEIISRGGYNKVQRILRGGHERYDSTRAAIEAYRDSDGNMLIHDAARPFISADIISSCICELQVYKAVVVAVPTTDTIIELSTDGNIARIPQRQLLMNAQTPQCFHIPTLKEAFDQANNDPTFRPTDDCSVLHRYMPHVPIRVVQGSEKNIKITYSSDITRAESMLAE